MMSKPYTVKGDEGRITCSVCVSMWIWLVWN
jgi:hypothetical protein